ncbi:MAG: DUF4179 domain-containing protein [Candidatus Onthomonas sp.]
MNRMEEYQALLNELERPVPQLEHTLDRAKARRRRGAILRPLAGLATAAAAFVLLVNCCAPVAYACAQVPILRELAELLRFNQSLSAALEHDYGQMIGQEQTENGITARVEYLIVDQKQVNVFYSVTGQEGDAFQVIPEIEGIGEELHGYFLGSYPSTDSWELKCATVNFMEGTVPDQFRLLLEVRERTDPAEDEPLVASVGDGAEEEEGPLLASFAFELQFDPNDTVQGRLLTLNQPLELDGQSFTLDRIEIYPTSIRFHLTDDPENTAWLVGLDYYLETAEGERLDAGSNGISASGNPDNPMMDTYYAESSYFYDTEELHIVITGAEFLDKSQERVTIDLTEQTVEPELPLGAELTDVRRQGDQITLEFTKPVDNRALFGSCFWTPEGEQTVIYGFTTYYYYEGDDHAPGAFETLTIEDYPYDQIILEPRFSQLWESGEPVELTIPVR